MMVRAPSETYGFEGPTDEHEPEQEEEPRILVVEDDDQVRKVFARALGRSGFEPVPCKTITAAREILENEAEHFEAAVLDYELPDGTAFDLVGGLLRRDPLVKSLVITGVAGPDEARRFVECGAHAFIAKPLTPPVLIAGVINTMYATLQWRLQTNQLLGDDRTAALELQLTEAANPLDIDPAEMTSRIRHLGGLSPMQTMVAHRLLWGDSDREIAEFLRCAERTAKRHVSSVLRRTGARTRLGLLGVLFRDSGFADDADPNSRVSEV